jgi:hypothetical protein
MASIIANLLRGLAPRMEHAPDHCHSRERGQTAGFGAVGPARQQGASLDAFGLQVNTIEPDGRRSRESVPLGVFLRFDADKVHRIVDALIGQHLAQPGERVGVRRTIFPIEEINAHESVRVCDHQI